jgi:hypothetical protein
MNKQMKNLPQRSPRLRKGHKEYGFLCEHCVFFAPFAVSLNHFFSLSKLLAGIVRNLRFPGNFPVLWNRGGCKINDYQRKQADRYSRVFWGMVHEPRPGKRGSGQKPV